jgi:lipopolysaccharide/colanic/teichoic acid biosynthesis glycosyltransferase
MDIMQSIQSQNYLFPAESRGDAFHRVVDLLLASLVLLLFWPLLLLTAGAVVLDSPGVCLFRQERVGRGGKSFMLLKFRTMRSGAESQLEAILGDNPELLQDWEKYQKLKDDPRLTRVGRTLRRFSLDELPQIFNVLRGEMSLVGPRPILPSQRDEYGPAFARYIRVRPGITGLWQVSGRNLLTFVERVRMDNDYLDRWSPILDFTILARTLWVVIKGQGAY